MSVDPSLLTEQFEKGEFTLIIKVHTYSVAYSKKIQSDLHALM